MVLRFEMSSLCGRRSLLQYMVPWLQNVELVEDPPTSQPQTIIIPPADYTQDVRERSHGNSVLTGSGWGSPEGTKVVLHNLLYITAKVSIMFFLVSSTTPLPSLMYFHHSHHSLTLWYHSLTLWYHSLTLCPLPCVPPLPHPYTTPSPPLALLHSPTLTPLPHPLWHYSTPPPLHHSLTPSGTTPLPHLCTLWYYSTPSPSHHSITLTLWHLSHHSTCLILPPPLQYGNEYSTEVESLWCALCTWTRNIRVTINYLARLTYVMGNMSLMLQQAKRIVVCFSRSQARCVLSELISDLNVSVHVGCHSSFFFK